MGCDPSQTASLCPKNHGEDFVEEAFVVVSLIRSPRSEEFRFKCYRLTPRIGDFVFAHEVQHGVLLSNHVSVKDIIQQSEDSGKKHRINSPSFYTDA
jgi:hypothetical protein